MPHPLLSMKFCETFRYIKFDPDVKVARLNVIIQLKSIHLYLDSMQWERLKLTFKQSPCRSPNKKSFRQRCYVTKKSITLTVKLVGHTVM